MKPPHRIQGESGFTFNELLVAMNVIAVGVLCYAAATIGVMRAGLTNETYTIAVNLAQERLEQLKAASSVAPMNNCPDMGDRQITATGSNGGIFDRCWIIADSPLGADLKQITVTVRWRDRDEREVTISTLFFTG